MNYNYENVVKRKILPAIFSSSEVLELNKHRILVTGAGGSIGSKIVELLNKIPTLEVLATDRDETALHSLSLKIQSHALFSDSKFQLLDIRDSKGIEQCLASYQPTAVIHAAALKHLSVLQKQPREAFLTNVLGTYSLLEASASAGVTHFVNISTDKAANPVSVLGNSKRIAELLTMLKRSEDVNLKFTNCRFGNVFASRGSVIETFASQIEAGGPITLTSMEVQRFFMHAEEAAYLTIKSLLMNNHDVHIFDMGGPVRLLDIINRMQEMSGTNFPIIETGLRLGEKMNEDLVSDTESLLTTNQDKIFAVDLHELRGLSQRIKEEVKLGREDILINYLIEGLQ
jgi:dTDP-glucose 4,6-dehydratase